MDRKVVGSMSEWSGMLKDLFRQIDDGSIGLREVQAFLEHKNPFEAIDLIKDWQDFYRDVLGINVNLTELRLPEKQGGFDRLIIVAQGMTPQKLFDKCKELFSCWKWTDENLDEIVNSERIAEVGACAVWFRDTVEADEDLKDLSANDLKERSIPGITLEERLLMELKYFTATGKHLNVNKVTLCAGSRYSDGDVPGVYWYGGKLRVNRYTPRSRREYLRSRRAVL